ncbi:hypothetical protein FOB58_000927 [Candida parapsilosis]|uniref:Uncharacterized protein n=1 Tax=Candida parapsilosis TaxID=5480 RepID=A0A8X7NR85_CANPA|nr:hypothetical protein FOB58_000927 [Candida parapsilosis]KAF6055972.1 hypothetical protein FOB59_000484 [Candida parapsilosis]KAF6058902.1 hypothetical protein FOB60_000484 [Candida parapsilosis]KAF6067659.1 hypothetical protein FOB61_000484 [Candida parapsilosis]CAD1808383.1 unnamed protein product [Candida parapsilosis]
MSVKKISNVLLSRPIKRAMLPARLTFFPARQFKHTTLFRRHFNNANYDTIVKNAVHMNRNGVKGSSLGGKRLPFRTILILIATSSSLSMMLYATIQYFRIRDELNHSKETNIEKSIFLPLWFNSNILWKKTLNYPEGLRYIDLGYYSYLTTEMIQNNSNNSNGSKSDVEEYCHELQSHNIKYAVLEKLSSNNKIRAIFGLPLNLTLDNSKFNIWIELSHPSVSGMQMNITQSSSLNEKSNSLGFRWAIKTINWNSIKDDTLSPIGLGMARIGSNAETKIHEKSSGKVHEVHQSKEKVPLNPNRDYAVKFQSEYVVTDKSANKQGKIKYIGTIDFDHLLINRGVIITDIELVYDDTSYKII